MTETEMCWLPVRCCCDGSKILGLIQVTRRQAEARYFLTPPKMHHEPLAGGSGLAGDQLWTSPPEQLEIRNFAGTAFGGFSFERAIYSEERPIGFWRTVKGFVEVAP